MVAPTPGPSGSCATSTRKLAAATTAPIVAATRDTTSDSATTCRTRRQLPAPIAVRTAISWLRSLVRANTRAAVFAEAITRSRATATNSRSMGSRTSPRRYVCTGVTLASCVLSHAFG